jgi:hypothetical protein
MKLPFHVVVMFVVLGQAATTMGQPRDGQPQHRDRVILKGFLTDGGRVNRVEGDVQRISSANQGAVLEFNQTLDKGDTIQSAASGRAEILLTPGYYLRLAPNTRITLLDPSPDNLKLRLWSGSAILELAINQMPTVLDNVARYKELSYEPVSFLTPSAEYIAASGGCYRFDVDTNGHSELSVAKGFAFTNGRRIDAESTRPDDEFDSWSRQFSAETVSLSCARDASSGPLIEI